jgi:endonuclease-8
VPEGDTVYLAVKNLRAALAGHELTRCDIRVPAFATVDFTGSVLEEVLSRGKHLLMRVAGHTIHTHLKMEGSWHLYRHGTKWQRPEWQARIILETADWVAVGFQLGVVEVVPTADEASVVGHLGPDLLGPDWDAGRALANFEAQPEREIGVALLDQRLMAGLGNVYRSEVCFLRGVLPDRRIADVPDLPAMIELSYRLIDANKDRAERTTTGSLRREATWVYGRKGRPCLRCGTPIRKREDFGEPGQERVVYWCPRCQS